MADAGRQKRVAQLLEAADIALRMVEHLANQRVQVEKADYDAIAAIQAADGIASPDAEHAFWRAYTNIVAKLPATDDPVSIYYSRLYDVDDRTDAPLHAVKVVAEIRRANRLGTAFSSVVLLLLVAILAYVSAVGELTDGGRKLVTEYAHFINGRFDLTRYVGQLENCTDCDNILEGPYKDVIQASVDATMGRLDQLVPGGGPAPENYNLNNSSTLIQNATIIMGFLNGYLVPLFAGTLGASLSILREIYLGFRSSRVSLRAFRIGYVRVALGAISGIAVGWFGAWVSGDGEGAVFTPLVLGFAAGYAVEVIFSLLDRLVAVLTGKDAARQEASAPAGS